MEIVIMDYRETNLNFLCDDLIREYGKEQSITEQLKFENQLEWAQKFNNIRACVKGIIYDKIISS